MRNSQFLRAAVACLMALSVCSCAHISVPKPKYPGAEPHPEEARAFVRVAMPSDERTSDVLGKYGSDLYYSLTYYATKETLVEWVAEGLASEMEAAGIRPYLEDPPEETGWVLRVRLLRVVYLHTALDRKAVVILRFDLQYDGKTMYSRNFARSGTATWTTMSPTQACEESLNAALQVALQHAVSEILEILRSRT